MAAYRHRATWRSITFNQHLLDDGTKAVDDPANIVEANLNDAYYLDELDFNRVSVQDYRELRQFLEGGEPNEAYEGVRAITGAGIIMGTTPGDLEDKAWAFNEAFSTAAVRIAAQSATPKGLLPFDFKRDTGVVVPVPATKALRFYARPGPGRPVWIGRRREGLSRPMSFQLIAFQPFAFDQAASQAVWAANPQVVTNPGNMYTYPTIVLTFSGAAAPGFTLTATSLVGNPAIVLNLAGMLNGQTLTIDTQQSTIVRDNGTNQYGLVTSGFLSNMILLAGANNWTISDATGISQLRWDFRGAYA